jgi:ribose transport system permease protein
MSIQNPTPLDGIIDGIKKNLGILIVFIVVFAFTAIVSDEGFLGAYNLQNVIRRASPYAILGIGMTFVIVTGGIDLSIGSLICLNACVLQYLMIQQGIPIPVCLLVVLVMSAIAGLCHGLLVTKVSLQPFVVTLCGLLIYRGLARWMTGDSSAGWQGQIPNLRQVATGGIGIPGTGFTLPWPFVVMVIIAILAAIFLHKTIYGRYLLALGRNEQAARYSGINTAKMTILAYMLCSVIAGIGGTIIALDQSLIQPGPFGTFYELYAIAAAVLGRCSLRGGQGFIFGVILGAALLPLIRNSISFLGIGDQIEFGVIGVVILLGVIVDEFVRRFAIKRRATLQAQAGDDSITSAPTEATDSNNA